MKKIFTDNKAFLISCVLLWIILSVLMLTYSKAHLHIMLNGYHNKLLDFFFTYSTEVGSWVPFVVAAGLLFYRYSAAILVLVTQLLVTIPVQLLKKYIQEARPKLFFEELHISLPKVDGVDMLISTHSFPSGHTAAAFSMFLCLSIIVTKPIYKFMFFVVALCVGFSRIYLSHHFVGDVFAGSVIGVLVTYIYYYIQQSFKPLWFEKRLIMKH